ncbi:hypothetical protein CP985_13015 [Malaciobacter mytili LMG 24559]|uniref:Fatty acyl-AMP ligase n=1 Tax=Malaciobacter mytili LMG 24559 TaxID=1032238 RepID=A0AAX2ACB9_9BACT|nr:AMP-binding protein [Malaciobacter mytili]AXH16215.1 fatty acyl-AMP ligase [Malaciobacter mytili LMG 24559]RXK13720.1 hypothetical protein CP985_13015 [Malaciobacter mytili LMG 24559]
MKKNYYNILKYKIFKNLFDLDNAPCLYFLTKKDEQSINRKNLNKLSLNLASHFIDKFPKDKYILVCMDPSIEFVVTLIGSIYSKITIVPIPVPRSKTEITRIKNIINELNIKTVITTPKYKKYFVDNNSLLNLDSIFSFDDELITDIKDNIINQENVFYELEKKTLNKEYKEVVVQYTSGTTNIPKGVKITSFNILKNYEELDKKWRFDTNKNFLTWLPIFHDMGLFSIIYCFLISGMKTYLMTPQEFIKNPINWLKLISEKKIYISGGPPFAYEMCTKILNENNNFDFDLSNWKLAFCGADYVSHQLLEEFRTSTNKYKLNKNSVFATYGMAEATLFILGEPFWENIAFDKKNIRTFSEGCYFSEESLTNLLIYNNSSKKIVKEKEEGEILICGDNLTKEYISQKLDTIHINGKEWFKTGDIGFIDKNCLFISGRIKNLIKIYGRNLFSNDIINVLANEFKDIHFSKSLIFKANELSNSVVVIIELNKKISSYEKDFLISLKENIKNVLFKEFGLSVENLIIVSRGSLPKTTSGKLQQIRIKELYKKGLLTNE